AGDVDDAAVGDGAADDLGPRQLQRGVGVDLDDPAAGGRVIGQLVVEQRGEPAHLQRALVADRALVGGRGAALDLGAALQRQAGAAVDLDQAAAGHLGQRAAVDRDVVQRQRHKVLDRHAAAVEPGVAVDLARAGDVDDAAVGNGAADDLGPRQLQRGVGVDLDDPAAGGRVIGQLVVEQ